MPCRVVKPIDSTIGHTALQVPHCMHFLKLAPTCSSSAAMKSRSGARRWLADPTSAFLGLRYLGGGASGTGTPDGTGDGYTENWLHFLTLTMGFRVR